MNFFTFLPTPLLNGFKKQTIIKPYLYLIISF